MCQCCIGCDRIRCERPTAHGRADLCEPDRTIKGRHPVRVLTQPESRRRCREQVHTLDAAGLAQHEPALAGRFGGGLFLASEGQLANDQWMAALAVEIDRLGGHWRESQAVERLEAGRIVCAERVRFVIEHPILAAVFKHQIGIAFQQAVNLSFRQRRAVLTLIGGGVFGNPIPLIWESILWAVEQVEPHLTGDLTVVVNGRNLIPEVDEETVRREVLRRGGEILFCYGSGIRL